MISQILPYLVGATAMSRVSEFGVYSEITGERISANLKEPLSGIYPEAVEMSLTQDIHIQKALHFLGYVCLKHKAVLELGSMSFARLGGISSAIVWICTSQDSFQALLITRRKGLIFILPPSAPVTSLK